MEVKPVKTRVFKFGENLADFVLSHIKNLPDKSIVAVASKVAAYSENRFISPTPRAKIKAIKAESDFAIKTSLVWLTIKDGMIMANAGIDESNAQGKIILLPKDSFSVAKNLRKKLIKKFKLKNLGVIITDSSFIPLRAGVIAAALGYSGFRGVKDYRGEKDIFGRTLRMSRVDVADSLATASALVMGEGAEQCPLAVISGAPVKFTSKIIKDETKMPLSQDIFGPMIKLMRTKI
ncbi:MAG: coenzyme F420-0:L-glutamate ligase [Elusimicrobia bacterium]|nr:coenzyme F420-0:L-glutamate ligase [Elusimicrobiota bacterium]